jgi:hypothetical protein
MALLRNVVRREGEEGRGRERRRRQEKGERDHWTRASDQEKCADMGSADGD